MVATTPAALRDAFDRTHDAGRLQRALDLGRDAATRADAGRQLDALAAGDVYARRLALMANFTLRDGRRVLAALDDASRRVRSLAFTLVPLCCDDAQAVEALQVAFALRRDRTLVARLRAHRRMAVIDHHLDWLAVRTDVADFADFVPLGSPAALQRHLAQALARPSAVFWKRLARYAPAEMGQVLAERLRAVPNEPDPVARQLLERYLPRLADAAPDEGIVLAELLETRGIRVAAPVWKRLAARRPTLTLSLLQRCGVAIADGLFARDPGALSTAAVTTLATLAPRALGAPEHFWPALTAEGRAALLDAWSTHLRTRPQWLVDGGLLHWGLGLISQLPPSDAREFAYQRWSEGARDRTGAVTHAEIARLPEDLRVREGRRHLYDVVALRTTPEARVGYARFVPWHESESAVREMLGHPEGAMRAVALDTLFACAGLRPDEPELADRCLALVLDRKHEQDPVRGRMIAALNAWPRRIWRPEHTTALGQMVRDALDASDCSVGTAAALESLIARRFHLDPGWAAGWLATLVKERGRIHDPAFARHLSDDDLRAAAPALREVATAWAARERGLPLLQLARGVGARMALVPGLGDLVAGLLADNTWEYLAREAASVLQLFDRARLVPLLGGLVRGWLKQGWVHTVVHLAANEPEAPLHPELGEGLERIARGPWLPGDIHAALRVLRTKDPARFDRVVEAVLAADESLVCLPEVYTHLHHRRQDLLDPFLGDRVITGRFATGKTRWILPFERGFHRWTPAQNTRFHATLAGLIADTGRDTPAVLRAVSILPRLEYAPADALCALADDARPPVREKAIRVMARCDAGQGVPTLVGCLDDARARFAIYGLRRALKDIPPARVVTLLGGVSLRKVTVAKEVLRILGALRHDTAYARLVALDGQPLHRDVRIALLRALWDHLDRDATWDIFARAVEAPDWVMAARLGDIPADRLTAQSDRKLSALLARILQRPEPEARIDLLRRAAHLAVRDPDRALLRACAARIASPYDDEVREATLAFAHRADADDADTLGATLAAERNDARVVQVAVETLLILPLRTRASWTHAARAMEDALAADARLDPLRVRVAAAWRDPAEWAFEVRRTGEDKPLDHDAMAAVSAGVAALPLTALRAVTERWAGSPAAEVRRAAVWALERDAGPDRGWTPERLARLQALQTDPCPAVAGAARRVVVPREMIDPRFVPRATKTVPPSRPG